MKDVVGMKKRGVGVTRYRIWDQYTEAFGIKRVVVGISKVKVGMKSQLKS